MTSKPTYFILFLVLLFPTSLLAQRITPFTVEPGDVQRRFPGAMDYPEGQWQDVTLVGPVIYSTEPLGSHVPRAKVGIQTWEFSLQEIMPVHEKAQVTFNVEYIPYGFRVMQFRARVTETVDGVIYKGDYTLHDLKLIGKTSNPFHTGE